MNLQSLGYVGVRTANLADWEHYATRLLGMQLVDKTRGGLALRMDDRKQRLLVNADGGEGAGFFGFEVKDAAALEAFAAHLDRHGVKVARGARALADERGVADLVVFSDPAGNRLEVFHGQQTASTPFQPGRCISGFRTGDVDQWATYATRFLGMQLVDQSHGTRAFRMDDRKQRLIVDADAGEGVSFYGWEVADAAAFDALAAHLEKSRVPVARGSRALAEERRVQDLIVFSDPVGNRLEAFHCAELAAEPFKPGRSISGFRTGPLGMGHAVLTTARLDQVMPFYTDILGFRLSDYILRPFTAYFFHLNPRHHSLAFVDTGTDGVHHLMVELCYLDDVGQAYDLALRDPNSIGATFGRHATMR